MPALTYLPMATWKAVDESGIWVVLSNGRSVSFRAGSDENWPTSNLSSEAARGL
jgi:hypothetical protein